MCININKNLAKARKSDPTFHFMTGSPCTALVN